MSPQNHRHTRPAYYRALVREGLIETPEESTAPGAAPEPARGDD